MKSENRITTFFFFISVKCEMKRLRDDSYPLISHPSFYKNLNEKIAKLEPAYNRNESNDDSKSGDKGLLIRAQSGEKKKRKKKTELQNTFCHSDTCNEHPVFRCYFAGTCNSRLIVPPLPVSTV